MSTDLTVSRRARKPYTGIEPDPGNAFDVHLSPDEEQQFTEWLCDEILFARDARIDIIADNAAIDYWWTLYECGSLRDSQNQPWPDAADLTSYLGTQYVDAIHARIMQTVFVEPIWIVEGWGDSADRAPLVEEFHQWQAKREKLPRYLSRTVLSSLVEGTGVLEVTERTTRRLQRRRRLLKIATNEQGAHVLDAHGLPQPVVDRLGRPVEAGAQDPAMEAMVTERLALPGGPQYRVLSLRDFLVLPGHARQTDDVWGYAKRFWRRLPELETKAKMGTYANVELIGTEQEREPDARTQAQGQDIAPQFGPTVEKELYEVLVLRDLDGDGLEEWYVATVSVRHRVLLRLRHDDLGQSRYLLFTPYPRTDSLYGYSLVGHKLETLIQEHTAWRNMLADRAAFKTNTPLKRLQSALWEPEDQPFGPGAVIDVRDMNEIQPLDVPDVPQGAMQREQMVFQASERVVGMNDVALGAPPRGDRPLGETQIVAQQSFVRMNEVTRNIQEAMEELFAIRHTLWQRALARAELRAPQGLVSALRSRGQSLATPGYITAADLQGDFLGLPRGSADTADTLTLRSDLNGLIMALANLSKGIPAVGAVLQDPEAAKSLFEQLLRVYRFQDRQAFMKAFDQALAPKAAPGQPGQPGAPAAAPVGALPAQPPMTGVAPMLLAQLAGHARSSVPLSPALLALLARSGAAPGALAGGTPPAATLSAQATSPGGEPLEAGAPA